MTDKEVHMMIDTLNAFITRTDSTKKHSLFADGSDYGMNIAVRMLMNPQVLRSIAYELGVITFDEMTA